LSGSSGRNTYSGEYSIVEESRLKIGELQSTLIGCDPKINEQETRYLKILSAVTTFDLESRKLTLSGPEGILVFKP
jgi:heat shock protein HslJ